MKCPSCGEEGASLVALGNQNYPAAFRCYNSRAHRYEYNFSATDRGVDRAEADAMAAASAALSRANATAIRKGQ